MNKNNLGAQSSGFLACLLLLVSTAIQAESYAKLFQKVDPAVVVIHTRSKVVSGDARALVRTSQGLGSGFVISEDGLIMTAAHVVQTSDKVAIEFKDGKKYPAKVVASSVIADVALLKLEQMPTKLNLVSLGNSDKVSIGDPVFVIGAPYGIEHTLTVGYLSGRRSHGLAENQLEAVEFLQTDAAINQGNSGGPVFNEKGEVIGIVSHIKTVSGGNEGLGFAASIQVAKRILLEEKSVWTGIEAIPLTPKLAAALNVPGKGGILIQRVAKKSLGDYLNLRPGTIKANIGGREFLLGGDVIVSMHGLALNRLEDVLTVRDKLVDLPYGSRIDVQVLREGKLIDLFTTKKKVP